jgi:hypothetical protein
MNLLRLELRQYPYEIDGKLAAEPAPQSEFVVDGVSLGERFGFEQGRPWFGRTCFDETQETMNVEIPRLRGLVPAENQLGSARFVLYRCHCGSDYCGVISCEIVRNADTIEWRDIRGEDEEGDNESTSDVCISLLRFDLDAYEAVIEAYVAQRPPA